MTAESKQAFYEEFTTYLSTIDDEEMASILKTAKQNTVTAFNEKCYVLFPEDLAIVHQKMTNQSCAKLYEGWTIDSKSNPTAVAAIFRKRTGKQSTCSGAVIPKSHIDQNGLKPMVKKSLSCAGVLKERKAAGVRHCLFVQLTCQEFVDAPVPKKWGREQEIAQEKSAVCHEVGMQCAAEACCEAMVCGRQWYSH